jgi:threonine aldolase
MMAAAASAALDYTLPRLSAVHAMTASAAKELEPMGYKFALPVQTNMIILDLEVAGIPGAAFVGYCKDNEVTVFPNGRLVFHHQTSSDGVSRLLKALAQLIRDKEAGADLMDHKVTGGYT